MRAGGTVPGLRLDAPSVPCEIQAGYFRDLTKLEGSYSKRTEDGDELQIEDLEIFENLAYIMALQADSSIPATIDEWLDRFDIFSIYQVLPQILELWGENLMTEVEAKKELAEVNGR